MPVSEVHVGTLVLQPRRQLLAEGRPVDLRKKPLDILSVLAEAGGELITKDELIAAVWPGVIVEENALQVHIAALRKAMGAEADRLVTVRGIGYRLDLPDQPEFVEQPQQQSRYRSVAVLPFANLTGDPASVYLGDGIAHELIAALSRGTDLKVPGWRSSFYYRGRAADTRAIGRHLGVETILEGWVKTHGGRVRISAQLVDAESGFHLWADSFERYTHDLATLQEELAASITATLQAHFEPRSAPTTDYVAFDLYLKARGIEHDFLRTEEVVALAERAISLDGRFARALSLLAGATGVLAVFGRLPPTALDQARRYAERALAVDPGLLEAHSALGWMGMLQGDWRLAADHSRDDGSCPIRSTFLGIVGKRQLALEVAKRSLAHDPACPATSSACGWAHLLCGEHEEALKRIEASVENGYPFHAEPLPLLRSLVALAAGDDRAAAKAMADGYPGALAEAGLGEVLQRCFAAVTGRGSCEIAVASLDRLMKLPVAQDAASVVGLATVLYTRLGSIDGAYRMAELLASQVESGRTISPMLGIFWHCELEAFRDDPRFIPLAEQLGFIEHWRRYGGPDCWSPDKAAADKVIERAASA